MLWWKERSGNVLEEILKVGLVVAVEPERCRGQDAISMRGNKWTASDGPLSQQHSPEVPLSVEYGTSLTDAGIGCQVEAVESERCQGQDAISNKIKVQLLAVAFR